MAEEISRCRNAGGGRARELASGPRNGACGWRQALKRATIGDEFIKTPFSWLSNQQLAPFLVADSNAEFAITNLVVFTRVRVKVKVSLRMLVFVVIVKK